MSIDERRHLSPTPQAVKVLTEREVPGGWIFDVQFGPASTDAQSLPSHVDLRLSWVDYEHWSHGSAAPERVALAVVEALLEFKPEVALPRRLDASTARRMVPGLLDERVRERVGHSGRF